MNEAVASPTPLSAPRSTSATWPRHRWLLLLGAATCVLLALANVFRREFYTGDEGFYGVTALNMVQSADALLRPTYFPGGDFFADRAGFAHPPFNSYLYAFALWLGRGSLAGPEVVHVLAFAALLFLAHRLLARFDRHAANAAVLLLAASPAMLASYSLLEAEPLMTTAGLAGVYCCVRGGERRWFFLGGLGLGAAFAFKLWLCGPLALAAAAAIALGGGTLRDKLVAFAVCFGGALIPAGLHLLAIDAWHPEDLGFWLREIYFGIFTNAGISGSKLSGSSTPAEWMHPVWYYAAALYRDHFFLVPFILFGGRSLLRDEKLPRRLVLVLAAGIAGLAPLSVMKVKEPLYVLSCAVFLYLLAAGCLAALARRIENAGGLDPFSRRLGLLGGSALLLAFPIAYARHVQPDKITGAFVLVHSVVLGATLAAAGWAHLRRHGRTLEPLLFAAAALAVGTLFAHTWTTRSPRDAAIAQLVLPHIQANPPPALSFVASNFKSYQYYTFRRGCYWRELPLTAATPEALFASTPFRSVRAFIIDAADQRKPALAPWLRWLETHTTEKTRNLEDRLGSPSSVRVFVREE